MAASMWKVWVSPMKPNRGADQELESNGRPLFGTVGTGEMDVIKKDLKVANAMWSGSLALVLNQLAPRSLCILMVLAGRFSSLGLRLGVDV